MDTTTRNGILDMSLQAPVQDTLQTSDNAQSEAFRRALGALNDALTQNGFCPKTRPGFRVTPLSASTQQVMILMNEADHAPFEQILGTLGVSTETDAAPRRFSYTGLTVHYAAIERSSRPTGWGTVSESAD